jgi:hypothetical protein
MLVDKIIDALFRTLNVLAPRASCDRRRNYVSCCVCSPHCWEAAGPGAEISGAYRIADDPADPCITPLARGLCTANSERIVLGSR